MREETNDARRCDEDMSDTSPDWSWASPERTRAASLPSLVVAQLKQQACHESTCRGLTATPHDED